VNSAPTDTNPLLPAQADMQLVFDAMGLTSLPNGAAELTRREMLFVQRVLEHGQMARAAIEAGYSEASAGAIASETLRKPKVFAFYKRCTDVLANDTAKLVRTTYERYVVFHAKTIEAAQVRADADTWLNIELVKETGKNSKERTTQELRRAQAQRDERTYSGLARAEGTLLAAMLGKLKIQIEGNVKVSVVTDEDRAHLTALEEQGVPVRIPPLTHTGGRN
jgi:phage terminase small subunit